MITLTANETEPPKGTILQLHSLPIQDLLYKRNLKKIVRPEDLDNLFFPFPALIKKNPFLLSYHVFGLFYCKYDYENTASQQDWKK